MREEERSRYQFEADEVDNQLEGELDDNLGEIGDAAKKLRALGLAMGRELDTQNSRIDRIGEKATNLDRRMFTNTHRVSFDFFDFRCVSRVLISARSSTKSSSPSVHCFLFGSYTECSKGFPVTLMTSDHYDNTYSPFLRVQSTYQRSIDT